MKTAVVGAGAMGSLFGGLLAEAGADVQLFDTWEAHVAALNAEGLRVESRGRVRTIPVRALSAVEAVEPSALVILFVKSMHTAEAARAAGRIAGEAGYVLTLQNGMGNVDRIETAVPPSRIIAGTTSHGATLLGPGRIRHAGRGPTTIGFWYGGDPAVTAEISGLFNAAGIQTGVSEKIREVVWDKLLVNVGINAITALTGIRNGQLTALPVSRELARAAVDEAAALARAQGVVVRERPVEHVFEIAALTAGNRSSMGQDVDRRRRTEIDAINGFVVRESEKMGLKAPVNRTLAALIETMQHHYETETEEME